MGRRIQPKAWAGALLALCGCLQPEGPGTPPGEPATWLFLPASDPQALPSLALVKSSDALKLAAQLLSPRIIYALGYQAPPATLGLASASLPLVPAENGRCRSGTRPFPSGAEVWRWESEGEWSTFDDLPPTVRELCMPALDARTCFEKKGCFFRFDGLEPAWCRLDCPPPPTPVPPEPPLPPTPPEPPQLGCDPATAPGCSIEPADCRQPRGTLLEALRCRHAFDDCGPERFASTPPAGRPWIYVDPSAVPPGDGRLNTPFASLDVALAAAPPDAVVLLSSGRHLLSGPLPMEAELLGACVRGTTLESSAPSVGGTLRLSRLTWEGGPLEVDGSLTLADVKVAPGPGGAGLALLQVRGALALEDVSLSGPAPLGVAVEDQGLVQFAGWIAEDLEAIARVEGGRLTGSRLRGEGVGRGLAAHRGAELDLAQVWLTGLIGPALEAVTSTVQITDLAAAGEQGPLIQLQEGAALRLRRAWLRAGEGGLLEASAARVEASDLQLYGESAGLFLSQSETSLRRVELQTLGSALFLDPQGAPLLIEDLRTVATDGCVDLSPAIALVHGELQLARAVLLDAHWGIGLGPNVSARIEDLEVGRRGAPCKGDSGVVYVGGGTLEIHRAHLYNLADHGVLSQGDRSTLVIDDLQVEGLTAVVAKLEALGLNLKGRDSRVDLTRAIFTGRLASAARLGDEMYLAASEFRAQSEGEPVISALGFGGDYRFHNFVLEGFGQTGLTVSLDSHFVAEDGLLRSLSPALQVPAEPAYDTILGLKFEDNDCNLDRLNEAIRCQ